MTRTLVVVRHAKAEQSHPQGDYSRELAPRGVADAQVLGRWLAEEELLPDLVLSSPAARTRQTTEQLLAGAGVPDVEVWGGRGLYDGGPAQVLDAVREVPEETATLWLVGHQPVMGIVTAGLADQQRSDRRALDAVEDHVPTASCAVLTLDVDWAELDSGQARLVAFHTARA
ncbi:SixA phosphatase family protein [Ornithinimicrobium pekingense]|uniref:Phosphohistidine phosphatase n=1 Tax=Ornithinimicrobium pekingense TaxID=384677 RepID=A0ABQ2F7B9_9MICO|nr:histidine phosphatase family protein [Ornithinimicrobium pekingense]GGK59379.1 phosphohistidine phosphatase [Ornithinimicrobium pekingense]